MAERRPIATRETGWARALAAAIARTGLTANAISVLGAVFAVLAGGAFLLSAGTGWRGWLVVAAFGIQLRLLCNMLDGMVAVEGGMGSRSGEVFNEIPDRIADPLLIIPAGYAIGLPFGPELGWLCGLLALFTAYIRALGGAAGLPQGFQGPMAKPHRMAAMTAGLIAAALAVPLGLDGAALAATLTLIALGALVTAWRRTSAILRALGTS